MINITILRYFPCFLYFCQIDIYFHMHETQFIFHKMHCTVSNTVYKFKKSFKFQWTFSKNNTSQLSQDIIFNNKKNKPETEFKLPKHSIVKKWRVKFKWQWLDHKILTKQKFKKCQWKGIKQQCLDDMTQIMCKSKKKWIYLWIM